MWVTIEQMTRENAGGKAAELAKMKKLGLQVPSFFVLTTEAATELSQREEPVFTRMEKEKLQQMVEEVCGNATSFSVRSSAQKEDSEDVSFAGLFETYLNVPREELADKIWQCLASVQAEHIQNYAQHHQLSAQELQIAVIIQEMIPADKAGVLFTANPNGLLNETVVIVGNGLGDGIVEATVPVTTYYVKRDEDLLYFEREEDSPLLETDEMQQLFDQVDRLLAMGNKLLDCEFAIYQGQVYYLQSRPITTLQATKPTILNNSNLVESYPGLTLPLTETFIQFAYEQVFKGVAWRFSKSEDLLETYTSAFRRLVVSANGRMYYQMNHLYSLLQFLPFPSLVLPIWHEMMGFDKTQQTMAPELVKNTSVWESLRISIRIFKEFLTAPKNMEQLNTAFQDIEDYFKKHFFPEMDEADLTKLYQALADRVLTNWDVTLVNDLYAFVYTGLLTRMLKKWGTEEDLREWNRWFSGIPSISSMEPVHALHRLATFVVEAELVDSLHQIKTDEQLQSFLHEHVEFAEQFYTYIRQYGDRSLEELKLETKTFRSHPLNLVEQIIIATKTTFNQRNQRALEEVEANLSLRGWKRRVFHFLGKRARLGVQHREASRLNRSRIYGMVRSIMLKRGELAVEKGLLAEKEDIFWLKMDELEQPNSSIVESRKRQYAGFMTLPPYGYLEFEDEPFDKAIRVVETIQNHGDVRELIGTPTSNGKIIGEILVVKNPTEVKGDASGKILVTRMTDPGWVFLLTQAKGVIAEKGSLLSHTAIISRELGIPAVVGIRNATEILQTGDLVELDGYSGMITIRERKEVKH